MGQKKERKEKKTMGKFETTAIGSSSPGESRKENKWREHLDREKKQKGNEKFLEVTITT